MLEFQDTAPADGGRSGFRLLRTPSAHPLNAYVLSDNLLGCKTHFIGNRTIPCEAPDCEACQAGVAWRWHGYLAILIDATQEIAIFEMTAKASAAFSAYRERYQTTRGCCFKAMRLNAKPNGRVLIQTKPADLTRVTLPKPPPVHKLLCHIWNIPETQVSIADQKPRPPFDDTKIDRTTHPIPAQEATEQAVQQSLGLTPGTKGNNRLHVHPAD